MASYNGHLQGVDNIMCVSVLIFSQQCGSACVLRSGSDWLVPVSTGLLGYMWCRAIQRTTPTCPQRAREGSWRW